MIDGYSLICKRCFVSYNYVTVGLFCVSVHVQQKNITDDANLWSRVFTGKGDPKLLATYSQWHEMVELPYWGSPEANAINGTEGFMFHPNIQLDKKMYAFIDNLFRSGYFTYNNSATVEEIDVVRFCLPAYELNNASVNPDNAAFFMNGPAGLMNMSALNSLHPPIFMSKPHFLDTPPDIVDSVVGLPPNREEHDSYLDGHALTGAVMRAHKRMQINVLIKPQKSSIFDTSKLRETFFPILYVDETATITPDLASEFRNRITVPMDAAYAGLLGAMILSAGGLFSSGLVLLYRFKSRRRKSGYTTPSARPSGGSLNDGGDTETTSLLQ